MGTEVTWLRGYKGTYGMMGRMVFDERTRRTKGTKGECLILSQCTGTRASERWRIDYEDEDENEDDRLGGGEERAVNVADFYGVSGVNGFKDVNGDGLFAAGQGGLLDVRAQLDQEESRLFRGGPAVSNFGQASYLL